MDETERLQWRVDRQVARALAVPDHLDICPQENHVLPTLRAVLGRPVAAALSLTLRVHSQEGIPLAHAEIALKPGDRMFETPLTLLAMEGYAHLGSAERRRVEQRMWRRRCYATGAAD